MKKIRFVRHSFPLAALCLLLVFGGCSGKEKDPGETAGTPPAQEESAAQDVSQTVESEPEDTPEPMATAAPAERKPPVIRVDRIVYDDFEHMNFIVTYDSISVEGSDYRDLADRLDEISDDIAEGIDYRTMVCVEDLQELDEESRENGEFELDLSINVERADEKVVSLRFVETIFIGVEHPDTYILGVNLNARTGETLDLFDVMEDAQAYTDLRDALIAELRKIKDEHCLDSDFEETVDRYFYEQDYALVWFYGEDGISFFFDTDILAPYAAGPIEIKIPLAGLRLAEIKAEDDADGEMKEVHVSTAAELWAAIGSNTRIYIASGVYDLTEWEDRGSEYPDNSHIAVTWEANVIKRVRNLELLAESRTPTQIVVQFSDRDVLMFERCENLVMEGLTIGHAVEPGRCTGDVLEFNKCTGVTLRNMDLYGCGTYGITASRCENFDMTESWIHDCTYGIMLIADCEDFHFKDSMFTACMQYTLLDGYGSELDFENCIFDKNTGEFLPNPEYYDNPTKFRFTNCKLLDGMDGTFEQNKDYVTIVD